VEFSEHEEAVKAIKSLNDTKLDGRYIYIREVKNKRTKIFKTKEKIFFKFIEIKFFNKKNFYKIFYWFFFRII